MFPKAKRFDDKPVGCGADAVYNPKDLVKPVGGVIPKVDRFNSIKSCASDTESIQSEKSGLFRTPKAVRRIPLTPNSKKGEKPNNKLLLEEFLEAKNVEIKNKDETIHENELQIKEMQDKIYSLESELKNSEINDAKISSLNEELSTLKDGFEDLQKEKKNLLIDIEECLKRKVQYEEEHTAIDLVISQFMYENACRKSVDYDQLTLFEKISNLRNLFKDKAVETAELKANFSRAEVEIQDLHRALDEKEKSIQTIPALQKTIEDLEMKTKDLDAIDEKRSLDILALSDLINAKEHMCSELNLIIEEHEAQIRELKEDLAMVKGQHALALEANESIRHEYKVEIDTLVAKHADELLLLEKHHTALHEQNTLKCTESIMELREENYLQLKTMEEKFFNQIEQVEEVATENIRISEIQFEERYAELQRYSDKQLNQEKQLRLDELQMCQEIAEGEIMKSEIQITDLQHELQLKENELIDLSKCMNNLQASIKSKEESVANLQSKLEKEEQNFADQENALKTEINSLKSAVDQLSREKNNFSLTLDSTRQTVDILAARLYKSDEDVMMFKSKYEEAQNLNKMLNEEIIELHIEFSSFKDEYVQLLTTIVESKSILDKTHNEILSGNKQHINTLETISSDVVQNIEEVKIELVNDIDEFKKSSLTLIDKINKKLEYERNLNADLKSKSDEAYQKMEECQNILIAVEAQLEAKDQEINELSQENDRLSGTLAASEQEKTELQTLLTVFGKLAEDKDMKIYENLKALNKMDEDINCLEDRLKKSNQMLEATEFIIKEKDLELENLRTHISSCKADLLQNDCDNLKTSLKEVTEKYSDLLSHQNNKQKIKHVIDLKAHNLTLKEENEKLNFTIKKQTALIEKLKKELGDVSIKSPILQKKQFLYGNHGKENRSCPLTPSPNKLGSPKAFSERPLTPLKDSNR